jgi:hypothetical protein
MKAERRDRGTALVRVRIDGPTDAVARCLSLRGRRPIDLVRVAGFGATTVTAIMMGGAATPRALRLAGKALCRYPVAEQLDGPSVTRPPPTQTPAVCRAVARTWMPSRL